MTLHSHNAYFHLSTYMFWSKGWEKSSFFFYCNFERENNIKALIFNMLKDFKTPSRQNDASAKISTVIKCYCLYFISETPACQYTKDFFIFLR